MSGPHDDEFCHLDPFTTTENLDLNVGDDVSDPDVWLRDDERLP